MNKRLLIFFLVASVSLALAAVGCKGRVEKSAEAPQLEALDEDMSVAPITEPAQTVAVETIPPTAAPEVKEKPVSLPSEKTGRDKDIQRALKSAGFYTGAIDSTIGPKTKLAIEEFQKAKGLKVDGKVGPRTWAELEKYLTQ